MRKLDGQMPHGVSGTPIKPLSTLDLAFAQTTFRAPNRVYAIDIMGMFGDWGRPEHQQAYVSPFFVSATYSFIPIPMVPQTARFPKRSL